MHQALALLMALLEPHSHLPLQVLEYQAYWHHNLNRKPHPQDSAHRMMGRSAYLPLERGCLLPG